ncbi:MAG: YfhO family protein, partial [Flavitalea sp.]
PAWLVKSVKFVNNADEEMKSLETVNLRDTAVLDKREQSKVTSTPQFDSTATLKLDFNRNDLIQYTSNSTTNQFAVFSEIYYPRGWKAFVDGKETQIAKVDYLLRGLPLAPGKHVIEFRFEPDAFILGDKIGLVIGIISFLILAAAAWYEWKRYKSSGTVKVAS